MHQLDALTVQYVLFCTYPRMYIDFVAQSWSLEPFRLRTKSLIAAVNNEERGEERVKEKKKMSRGIT